MISPTYTVTEGDWELSGDSIISGDVCIATLETDGGYEAPAEERAANGGLIVSAKAMLALLVESRGPFGLPAEWIEKRDALIAKITGGQK